MTFCGLFVDKYEQNLLGGRCDYPLYHACGGNQDFWNSLAFGMDQEIPDYDMDSEDETWLTKQAKKMEVTPLQFENMMDRLEKGSGQVVGVCGRCNLFSVQSFLCL